VLSLPAQEQSFQFIPHLTASDGTARIPSIHDNMTIDSLNSIEVIHDSVRLSLGASNLRCFIRYLSRPHLALHLATNLTACNSESLDVPYIPDILGFSPVCFNYVFDALAVSRVIDIDPEAT
jgi:hypothetical protein